MDPQQRSMVDMAHTAETRQEELLTPSEVAQRLRVSVQTVYGLVQRGLIPAVRIGAVGRGVIRVSEEDLRAYLEGARTVPPAAKRPSKLKHLEMQKRS